MNDKLRECPFCGNRQVQFIEGTEKSIYLKRKINGITVHCHQCGARTRLENSYELALESWNIRSQTKKGDKNGR